MITTELLFIGREAESHGGTEGETVGRKSEVH